VRKNLDLIFEELKPLTNLYPESETAHQILSIITDIYCSLAQKPLYDGYTNNQGLDLKVSSFIPESLFLFSAEIKAMKQPHLKYYEITKNLPVGDVMRAYLNKQKEVEGVGLISSVDGKKVKEICEYKGGKRHGIGLVCDSSGNKYFGEMIDGQNQGNGILTYADSTIYKGQWNAHARNGYGIEI
jgi:hypothetical protein